MKRRNNLISLSVIIGLLMYLADAVIYSLIQEVNLFDALFNVPIVHIFSRLLMIVGIVIFGLLILAKINENLIKRRDSIKVSKDSSGVDYNFLSSLSYQIRTPLNAIIGFSELLQKNHLSEESKSIYINHINSSGKYLLLLITNLSEISKIESNKLSITRVETNINKIMEEMFQVFEVQKHELGKSAISLEMENVKQGEDLVIMTDPQRLRYVLNNLLENAFIHTKKGTIRFGYLRNDRTIEFYVKDNSVGFSQERLEVIFERYNKLTDNFNLPFDGSVIRLAISKSIVKLLGGDIHAESAPGQGVSIYFTVPVLEKEKPVVVAPVIKPSAVKGMDWADRTLLIAEDVDSNYIYLEEILRSTKINVLWAKNGQDAVNMVKSNEKIEIVLMDILMPVMDGYEASREIKKIRKNLPIIAQTAYFIEDKKKDPKNANFDKYLIKPLWAPQLIKAIEELLQ